MVQEDSKQRNSKKKEIKNSKKPAKKSDHIIHDKFKDWSVRHYFDAEALTHKFSDAKTLIKFTDGSEMVFQINQRNDNHLSFIINGWWDVVNIYVDDKKYEFSQGAFHTFYGDLGQYPELVEKISNTHKSLRIELILDKKIYKGIISTKGSSAALRWIRVIK